MLKNIAAAALLCAGSAGFAGFIDHGDATGMPRISGYALEQAVAWKYFPEVSKILPVGLPRREAWTQDIKKAAEGLNIKRDDLEKLTVFVLDPAVSEAVKAPHAALYEFELYARGRRELYMRKHSEMPASWKKLLSLPVNQRRYTTVPVLRGFARYRQFHDGDLIENEQALAKMLESLELGCLDTQGCILHLIDDIGRNPRHCTDWASAYRMLFRKQFVNNDILWSKPEYKNIKPPAGALLESMASHWDVGIDMLWALYTEEEERLREMCRKDPAMRDLIVCIGLTNRIVVTLKKVAWEFYRESVINYPAAAVKLPLAEAVKLLEDHPQHHDLRDLLIIKSLHGEAKIRAIDQYIAKYPDHAATDKTFSCVMLNSHAELHAMAGAELFKLGRPYEAAVRWINGCTAEDMGMVAEQIMSIDELKAFCRRYFPHPVMPEQKIYSSVCEREYIGCRSDIVNKDQLNFMLRNLLARRLMRAGRLTEAREYFTGDLTRSFSERFFALHQVIDSGASQEAKLVAVLNMAALVRNHGDKLFGTFLEPDNLICKNQYPCTWGTKQKFVKLKKPELPRYSYRYRAAELYARAAEMTEDRTLKSQALWTAGTLLKNRSPKLANLYFKKLFEVAPELTDRNWFKPMSKTPVAVQEFFRRTCFVNGDIAGYVPKAVVIRPVALPVSKADKEALARFGAELCKDLPELSHPRLEQALYALKLAGDLGVAEADIWSAAIQSGIYDNNESALFFLRRAGKNAPDSLRGKFALGQVYIKLGYWQAGLPLIQEVADKEKGDREISGQAAFQMARFFYEGLAGVTPDAEKGRQYLEKAKRAGFAPALEYKWPPDPPMWL